MRADAKDRKTPRPDDGSPDDGKNEGGFPVHLPPAYVGEGQAPDDVGDPEPTLEPVPPEELEDNARDAGHDDTKEEERREGPRR